MHMKRTGSILLFCILSAVAVHAQEFEIISYDLKVKVDTNATAIDVDARMRLVNLSAKDLLDKILLAGEDKPRLSFFLNPKAKVTAMTLQDNAVQFRTSEDVRNNLIRVSTDITSAIASAPQFEIGMTYTLSAVERNPWLRVSVGESFVLPPSFWVPVNHTPFGDHGADTAPFTITVTPPPGQTVVSGGLRKSETTFQQSLADQPYFIVGDFETIGRGGDNAPAEIYVQRGLNESGKQQAQRLAAEAEKIVEWLTKYFNYIGGVPLRVVSAVGFGATAIAGEGLSQGRESSFTTTGTLLIDDTFFRRDVLDVGTIELMTSTAARTWIDGRVLLRGRGAGMLRDALPIYLTARYLGDRSGENEMEDAFERYHRGYAPLARGSDGALLLLSPLDRNYRTSMYNKGALVWRLFEKQFGRAEFDNLVRSMLDRQRVDILSLSDWKHQLCTISRCSSARSQILSAAGAANRKAVADLFAQWVETVVLPDFAIGQPQKTASGAQESTIVNFGSGDFSVDLLITTASGEKIRRKADVRAGEFGTIELPAGEIVSIEADPEKIFPQRDYSNDSWPRRASIADLYGQANTALAKGDAATAESKAREAIAISPGSPALEAFLGRVLLAQKKDDEAAKVFASVLKNELITMQAYAWAHLGLGEMAAQAKRTADAARHFSLAAAADVDPATTLAARNGLLAAEREAGLIKIPNEVGAFLKQLDAAILQGSADAVNPLVDLGGLRRFAQSLVVRKPTVWQSTALRAEELDANRVAVDVDLKLKIEGKDYSGRALYVLRRAGSRMLLGEVLTFDVK
jgi:tetratricopeptide (TPR) repeat protein